MTDQTSLVAAPPRVTPWRAIGQELRQSADPARYAIDPTAVVGDVLASAGLDWPVDVGPVYDSAGLQVRGFGVTTRRDSGAHLGIVGSRFTPVQNEEVVRAALRLATADGHRGEARVTHAGLLSGGRRVWLAIEDAVPFSIGPEDDFYGVTYLVGNGHDGGMSLTVSLLTTRLSCTNQVIPTLGGENRVWSWRHTRGIAQRREEVILTHAHHYLLTLRDRGERLATERMSEQTRDRFLHSLIPYTPLMEADPGGRAAHNREEAIEAIRALHRDSPNLQDIRGSAWGVYQAVVEYADWERPVRARDEQTAGEYRFARAVGMSSTTTAFKTRALRALERTVAA